MLSYTKKLDILQKFIFSSVEETLKPAKGILKHPYVSPGGPYAVQLWDWDSYWTIYAAANLAKRLNDGKFLAKLAPHARGTFFNFLDHQGKDGAIPICLTPEQEDVFDCLKSGEFNMAKPFIGQTGLLLFENGMLSIDDVKKNLGKLRKYHACTTQRYLDKRTGLYFWACDWAIGVDDDPAAWGRPAKSCATLYQNVFMYRDMLAVKQLCEAVGEANFTAEYGEKCEALKASIEKFCWDKREKSFFSVDLQCNVNRTKNAAGWELNTNLDAFWLCLPLKVLTWNSILPFWAGMGTKRQFKDFIGENLVAERLWSDHGIRSLSKDEPMYRPEEARGNPSNWLGPIWLIANYICWDALNNGGHRKLAKSLARNLVDTLYNDLKKHGKFHEYYSPETGKGIVNPGFMSWNALASLLEV